MKNTDLISKKLENALIYLYKQEETLKPFIDYLQSRLLSEVQEKKISVKDAFDMLYKLNEQYTNSILLIAKIKEIIEFSD